MARSYNLHVFADLIEKGRERAGLRQAEVGERMGLGQQAVSKWERALARPRPGDIPKLAEILHLDAVELLVAAGYMRWDDTWGPAPTKVIVTENYDPRLAALAGGWEELSEEDRELIMATFRRLAQSEVTLKPDEEISPVQRPTASELRRAAREREAEKSQQ